jgi:hypothetical protein
MRRMMHSEFDWSELAPGWIGFCPNPNYDCKPLSTGQVLAYIRLIPRYPCYSNAERHQGGAFMHIIMNNISSKAIPVAS